MTRPGGWRIAGLRGLPDGIEALRAAATGEGFGFVERLVDEWRCGANRFDGPGERLLGGFGGDALLGVCGLNRDPYAEDAGCGRLRHLYVRPEWRRAGLATELVHAVLRHAGARFRTVRLRSTPGAAAFYERLGFVPEGDPFASHVLALRGFEGRGGRPEIGSLS